MSSTISRLKNFVSFSGKGPRTSVVGLNEPGRVGVAGIRVGWAEREVLDAFVVVVKGPSPSPDML